MAKTKKEKPASGHYGLYLAVQRLQVIVSRERTAHPRTKVWKDLEDITQQIAEIQSEWFRKGR